MTALLASFALFIALHSVPAIPAIRSRLIGRLGRGLYFTLYSIASTGTLVAVFASAYRLDYLGLWDPAPWQAWVTILLAPLGLFFVIAGLISPNPLSITLRQDQGRKGAIVRLTRHPVLVGFLFWAVGHIVPNGDLRSVILFGSFALFALGGIAMQEKRARKRLGLAHDELAAGTGILPFLSLARNPRQFTLDTALIVAALSTLALTALLLSGLHASLIGVDPLALATAW